MKIRFPLNKKHLSLAGVSEKLEKITSLKYKASL